MKYIYTLASIMACVPALGSAAVVFTPPSLSVSVGGSPLTLSTIPTLNPTTGLYSFQGGTVTAPIAVGPNYSLTTISFDGLNDPYVDYGFSIKNTGTTPLTVSFTVMDSFFGGPYNFLTDSFSDSVTDSGNTPDGQVTITVPSPNVYVDQPFVNGTNYDGINSGCKVTGTPGFSGPGCVTSMTANNVPIATTGATGTFGIAVNFTLSAGDIYTINGRAALSNTAVPEPATAGFLSAGMAFMLGLVAFRRNRKLES